MNFSKQRESIINVLKSNFEHPTAYRVYELVKQVEPTISKSTVYRNLEQLVEVGLVKKISTGDNFEHYDIERNDGHSHLVCKCCGEIFDINSVTHPLPLNLYFGTLAVDLGCFPFDNETYLTLSDSHKTIYGIRSLIRFGKL